MARTVKDTNLQSREKRLGLAVRRNPYWRALETGLHIGYRRTATGGGTWVARRLKEDGRYSETRIAPADDLQDADGVAVMTFSQVQAAARNWWRIESRRAAGHLPDSGPYTVNMALADYFAERERAGSKGAAKDQSVANLRIVPALGEIEITKLTTRRIRDWQGEIAKSGKIGPAGRFTGRKETAVDTSDADATRARRASANRVMTILRAALNHAYREGHVAHDDAWRKVKPFKQVDSPVVRFLSDDECRRLVNASQGAFRDIVRAALVSGCRYGELCRMTAADYNASAGTITVRESKAGKPRHVALTDEGQEIFAGLVAGKAGRDLIFIRDDGEPWGPSHQQRPLDAASKRAKIEPAASFHVLRHSYASALAQKGVPMSVIGAQLGHSPGSPITARHYAHLSPNYIADTVRAALSPLGIAGKSNVKVMKPRDK